MLQYLDVFHVGVMKFFSEMRVLFQEIDNLSEISIIVQAGVLKEVKLDLLWERTLGKQGILKCTYMIMNFC